MKQAPFLRHLSNNSGSPPPVIPYSGLNGPGTLARMLALTRQLPVHPETASPVLGIAPTKRGPPFLIHSGASSSKLGKTGPKTASARYSEAASTSVRTQ